MSAVGRGVAWVVGSLLALFAVMLIGVYGFGWFSNATANFRGDVQKRNLTNGNGSYRIAAYEHFFDLCAGVQTKEAAIANAELEAKTASAVRKEQLQAVITANRNERADLINQYNADAHEAYTRAQFHASSLPFTLDSNQEHTQCAL